MNYRPAQLRVEYKPQYVLTYIPKGKKAKKTETIYPLKQGDLTPMEILIKAKEAGMTPTNLRPDPECPVVIVLSWES